MPVLTYVAELDDNSVSFHYAGPWSSVKGTSSEYQSTIHSTNQSGASAAVRFIATRAIIYVTLPAGKGTSVRATVSLDGQVTKITRATNSTTVFGNVLFDSGTMSNTTHTLILTNAGSTTDSPLQLDRVHLQGSPILDIAPVTIISSTGISTSSIHTTISSVQSSISATGSGSLASLSGSASILQTSVTGSNAEVVSLPQDLQATATTENGVQITDSRLTTLLYSSYLVTSTEADGTVVTEIIDSPRTQTTFASSSARAIPSAAIVGSVIGVLGLIALAIILLLLRLRFRRVTKEHMRLPDETTPELNVTPFDIREPDTVSSSWTTRTTYHEAAGVFPRNEKNGSLYTANNSSTCSAVANAQAQGPSTSVRNLPPLTFERQDGTHVFVPHHRNVPSASSSTIICPETESPTYSRAIRSSAISLNRRSNDSPPSYQFNP